MLRIHFEDRDLARVQIAAEPDPLWETVLAMHHLVPPGRGVPVFGPWRARARRELDERGLIPAARLIGALAPAHAPYFPDFLTPDAARDGLAAGLAALRDTPGGGWPRRAREPRCRPGSRAGPARWPRAAGGRSTNWRPRSRRCTAR